MTKNPLEFTIVEFTDLVRHWANKQDSGTSVMFTAHYPNDSEYDANHTVSDTFMRAVGPAAVMAFITSAIISGERKARANSDFEIADMLQRELEKFKQVFGLEPKVETETPSRKVQ